MTHGDKLDDIIQAAVVRGDAPGVVAAVWGFGMQGAMFMGPEPWPIVTAVAERELASFGPPQPGATPDPDTWMARLAELPLLAQPGERWLYVRGGAQGCGQRQLATSGASSPS